MAHLRATETETRLLSELRKYSQRELGFSSTMPVTQWRTQEQRISSSEINVTSRTQPLALDWNKPGKTPWTTFVANHLTHSFVKSHQSPSINKTVEDVRIMLLDFLERQKVVYQTLLAQKTGAMPTAKGVKRKFGDIHLDTQADNREFPRKRRKRDTNPTRRTSSLGRFSPEDKPEAISGHNLMDEPPNAIKTLSTTLREDLPPPIVTPTHNSIKMTSLDDIILQLEKTHLAVETLSIKLTKQKFSSSAPMHTGPIVGEDSSHGEAPLSDEDVLDRHFFQATVRQYPGSLEPNVQVLSLAPYPNKGSDRFPPVWPLDSDNVERLATRYLQDMESKTSPYLEAVAPIYRNKKAIYSHFKKHNQYTTRIAECPVLPSIKQVKRRNLRSQRLLKSRLQAAKTRGDASLQKTLELLGSEGMSSIESDDEDGSTVFKSFSPIWRSKDLAKTFVTLDNITKTEAFLRTRPPSLSMGEKPVVLRLPLNFYDEDWLQGLDDEALRIVKVSALEHWCPSDKLTDSNYIP